MTLPRWPWPPPQVWTPRQRAALVVLLGTLLAAIAVARWRSPTFVPDPPGDGARARELATRLDPNTADAESLAALPGLGESRARAIVDYRAAQAARHAGRPAFTSARDLLPIHGIGVAVVENLAPHLTFPATRPAGR